MPLEAEKCHDLRLANSRGEKSRWSGSNQAQRPGHQVRFRWRAGEDPGEAGGQGAEDCLPCAVHTF